MALHVAHLDLAGGKLVAAQDQDELGAHLIGLLKLGLERTALIVRLGHDTRGAKLLRNGKDVLAQFLAGIGDIDARGLIGTQIAAKGLQGQQGALKTDSKADARRPRLFGLDGGVERKQVREPRPQRRCGCSSPDHAPGWDPRHTRYRRHPDSA